jgi:ribosome biogenesis GTPase
MSRDYSQFLPPQSSSTPPERQLSPLEQLGWQPFFAQQTSVDEMAETPPMRLTEIHRNTLHLIGNNIETTIPPGPEATVGDWLLFDHTHPKSSRVLERKSLIKRRAPGSDRQIQNIAANIDTIFIVSSCNQDFNIARLERYGALAFEADVTPVILLTKSDLADDPETYIAEASTISDRVPIIGLDARGDAPISKLAEWCKPGQTVAFLGSSGVGKSTLLNSLSGTIAAETQSIRDDDAKGRHTTTHRQLHKVPGGCLVLDTPGMRELQLTDAASGIQDLFSDLEDLSQQCRFRDCSHAAEPGCAVLAAIESGDLDTGRLGRWKKLVAEEQFNSASLTERRSKDKAFGKMIKSVKKHSKK